MSEQGLKQTLCEKIGTIANTCAVYLPDRRPQASVPLDSHYAHIAWMRSIKDSFGVEVPVPIITDLDMKVAQTYGMIELGAWDTQAVRATSIIDPHGVLRAMVYYPMNNGRSVDKFVRLVKALQTADTHKVATPENGSQMMM